jgi:hypothetical protein
LDCETKNPVLSGNALFSARHIRYMLLLTDKWSYREILIHHQI